MIIPTEIKEKLEKVFGKRQAAVLAELLVDAYGELARVGDFRELKAVVRELAEAQGRTEEKVRELAEIEARTEERLGRLEAAVERLVEAQARTDERVGRLEAAVEKLVEAQARTDERVGRLEAAVERLVEAQARTDERVGRLEAAVEKLVEAQARTDERVGRLEAAVERLAEAQARTEERVGRLEAAVEKLVEVQARTDERVGRLEAAVERLAEAQARTEKEVRELATAIGALRRQVGGLSETVGGDIEDIAYIVLHDVLRREFGWEVGVLERSWQTWNGEPEEVNVFGQARDPKGPERDIWIVGEAKHNLTAREVERFLSQVERARRRLGGELFPVCFCYRARPEVQQMVREAGIRLVFSYGKMV